MFTWPSNDIDRPAVVAETLGSFWESLYQGHDLVAAIVAARCSLAKQTDQDMTELIDSLSRRDIAIFHQQHWRPLVLLQSRVNPPGYALPKFDSGLVFDGSNQFDVPATVPYYAWAVPANLVELPLLFNRIAAPSRTLVAGVDYLVSGGYIIFRSNPFDDTAIPSAPVIQNNVTVDRACGLWAFNSQWDNNQLYRQFGYVLQTQLPGSQAYKDLLNAIFDSLIDGTTAKHLADAWAAITGTPLARGNETVQVLYANPDGVQCVVTDQNVYHLPAGATVTVAAGDRLQPEQSLCDALKIHEFNRGQCPTAAEVSALALGKGMLMAGFFGDLVFNNQATPLVVTTDADGFTKLSWELGGWPGDVDLFFDELHQRGRASGQTLAHLLDQRPIGSRDTEPTAGALPATINPFAFLCQNILRNHAILVVVRPTSFGGGTGMAAAKLLRKIVPPQTVMLVLAELAVDETPITMDGEGNDTRPGYTETGSAFPCVGSTETLDPANVSENVRCYQVSGQCA